MSYPIQPVVKPQPPIIIDSVFIRVSDVSLGTSAVIDAKSYYGDSLVTSQMLVLSQPEYSEWGSDDEWLVNWVFTQLGYSRPSV